VKIRYVTGDVIEGDQSLIVHGCNAQGVGRSGVFAAIRERLPFAYDVYRMAFDDPSFDFRVGNVVWAFDLGNQNRSRIVGNLITQDQFGRTPGRVYVSYEAIAIAFRRVNEFVGSTQDGMFDMKEFGPIGEVGMPLIGAGLGGGKWPVIADIVERESVCFQPVVYTLDGIIPN
jgi:O-acetyl-ADP-ribose deacetylase (regulator of RNase III)